MISTSTGLHHVEYVMGMAVSIDSRDDVVPTALQDVITWLHHVDATFSTYKMDSSITRYALGELRADELSTDVTEVLALCENLREETGGAFNCSVVPAPNGTNFDPSGLVKGWSIERAAQRLEAHGLRNFCINGGGDIAVRGESSPGQPWRIGIRHPFEDQCSAAVVDLSGAIAIATSATYERGAHIIDPCSGQPTAELSSVTIIGEDLTFVDAYATSVFVMGLDGVEWLMDTQPGYDAFVIGHDGLTWETPGFAARRSTDQ